MRSRVSEGAGPRKWKGAEFDLGKENAARGLNPGMQRCLLTSLAVLFTSALTALAQTPAPPPALEVFKKDARILFQGDSITDGNRGRSPDPNHILGHGYQFIIAAKYGAAYADRNLTFINRGISGNTVGDLAKRWQKETIDLKPDVLSILIGVNDTARKDPIDEFERGYDQLLADARKANPEIRLVLCAPFMLPIGHWKADYETWFANIKKRQEIVAKLAQKYHAAYVNFQPVFEAASAKVPAERWLWDGIHPSYSGHQLMADEWERVVREFWPPK